MRSFIVLSLLGFALHPEAALAASFDAPLTLGGAPTLATAAVAGGDGTFAFVARRQDAIVGAVRAGAGAAWQTRTLATGRDYSQRDEQIVMGSDGAVTALWTATGSTGELVAARAPAGAGFGPARVVARINDADGARPRLAALPDGRVLAVFLDRTLLPSRTVSAQARLKTLVLQKGRSVTIRDLGVVGAFPAVGRVSGGALLAYVAGNPRCRRSVCAPRALRATLLDASGRRAGPTVTVDADSGTSFNPPRVATRGTRAVVSWVRPGRTSGARPFAATWEYSTHPLRPLDGARTFPVYGGPGTGSAAVAILSDGGLLGADVGASATGEGFGGKAELSVAAPGAGWQAPSILSADAGWTTVPQVRALGDGAALLFYARSRSDPGPVDYDVMAAQRDATGATTQTTLGSSLRTNDAGGLSSSVAADGQAIVTWPDAAGGVAVTLRR